MADRLQYQLDALERLLVTTLAALFRDTDLATIADKVFKGHAGQARQFAGILAMHLNRGPETQGGAA